MEGTNRFPMTGDLKSPDYMISIRISPGIEPSKCESCFSNFSHALG